MPAEQHRGPIGPLNERRAMLLGLELPRAAAEAASMVPALPVLGLAPRGDGHPVLVLPGLAASDVSTRVLRGFLRQRNYHVHAWRLGRNLGPDRATVEGLRRRVRDLYDHHGRPLSIVGWSLGGVYATEIARAAPEVVRQVITLGSPLGLGAMVRADVNGGARGRGSTGTLPPAGVPFTAVYSRTDAIVPWRAALVEPTPTSENIEVRSSHIGLGMNPAVLWIVADRLALPEGQWRPYEARGFGRWVRPPQPSAA
ncbi:MAG TPA: alpha/beta fold hydrolase [Acidimicrobiales bacterium]|nr:alpha/beta fold hydrolase [Acidimicrobiales bacterium]